MTERNYRRQMCKHCAFRKESIEMQDPEQRADLLAGCMTKVFLCHETMHQNNAGESKWIGSFDHHKDKRGKPCSDKDHQICAGFAALYGPEMCMPALDVNIEGHAMKRIIISDRKTYAEIRAAEEQGEA